MQETVLNISPVVVWVVALAQLLTFGLTIWGLMASGSRANATRLEEHGRRIDGHGQRLASVEQSLDSMPRKDDVQHLALAMAEIKGDVKVMRAEMGGAMAIMERLEAIVSRHEEHLLKG